MSDYFSGTIEIGGQLPASELPFFIQAINNETNLNLKEEIKEDISPKEFLDLLDGTENIDDMQEIIQNGGSLRFFVSEARYGRFEDIESFCVRNGLTFIRYSEAYGEYEADIEWWQPGMEQSCIRFCDNYGHITIRAERIRETIESVKRFNPKEAPLYLNETAPDDVNAFLAKWSLKNEWDAMEALKARLDYLAPRPPEVGKFEIIP